MEKKQSIKIPKFVWVLAFIIVICIVFLIAVQIPFTQKLDKYNKDHESATSQINQYKDYLERATEVQDSIDKMKKQCEEKEKTLTINAEKTADDIRDMLKNLDYDLSTLSIAERKADTEGRISATGDPLYATTIDFRFTSTEQKLLDTLKYFESESDGSYYVSQIVIKEATVDSTGDESEQPVQSAEVLYDVTLKIQLYFFDMSKNQGANASGVSLVSGQSSGESSAQSSAS